MGGADVVVTPQDIFGAAPGETPEQNAGDHRPRRAREREREREAKEMMRTMVAIPAMASKPSSRRLQQLDDALDTVANATQSAAGSAVDAANTVVDQANSTLSAAADNVTDAANSAADSV